jgi:hypothetical protein
LWLVSLLLAPACAQQAEESAESADDQELVSKTALERNLSFEGYVYVPETASDAAILSAVQRQTQTMFGPLRIANVSVAKRELKDSKAADLKISATSKETVQVLDAAGGSAKTMKRVRYKYDDVAIVPKTMARRSSLALGVLVGDYEFQTDRVMKECTNNDKHDQEMRDVLWYVFNPGLSNCKKVMNAEQQAIDAARKAKGAGKLQVVQAEINRLYLPASVRLAPGKATNGQIWPEYDRLWAGGVQKDVVSVALVNGEIDHGPGASKHIIDDSGYAEMMEQMEIILAARPNLKIVGSDPATDMTKYTVNDKKVTGATFQQFVQWERDNTGFPADFSSFSDQLALRKAVGERLHKRWVILEEQVSVKIGTAAARKVTVRVKQFFGAGEGETPHRKAIQTSDVVLYNGHSYIGSGPWDPERYSASDFPKSYQIFFFDSCVSYNYYNKDYFTLKANGSKDLETITNGVESFSDGSGGGLGRFLVKLLDGTQASYLDLLTVAGTQGTDYAWGKDALRVVDGEADNQYKPSVTKIVVTK